MRTIFHRIYQFFLDLFYPPEPKQTLKEFYDQLAPRIEQLRINAAQLDQSLPVLKELLLLCAKVETSVFGKELGIESPEWIHLREKIEAVQQIAREHLPPWKVAHPDPISAQLARWTESNREQQRYAAYMKMEIVPYRFEEIPAGSVLLTHPRAYLASLISRGKGYSTAYRILLFFKELICWLITGTSYTHAELVLTNGKVFDLDKEENNPFVGRGVIKDRTGRVCYLDILTPKEEKMLPEFRANRPAASFADAMQQIENEVTAQIHRVHAKGWDILKTGLRVWRKEGYDPASEWRPGEIRLGCAPYIAALYGHFGIDLGEKYKHQSMTPADFETCGYFNLLYKAPIE